MVPLSPLASPAGGLCGAGRARSGRAAVRMVKKKPRSPRSTSLLRLRVYPRIAGSRRGPITTKGTKRPSKALRGLRGSKAPDGPGMHLGACGPCTGRRRGVHSPCAMGCGPSIPRLRPEVAATAWGRALLRQLYFSRFRGACAAYEVPNLRRGVLRIDYGGAAGRGYVDATENDARGDPPPSPPERGDRWLAARAGGCACCEGWGGADGSSVAAATAYPSLAGGRWGVTDGGRSPRSVHERDAHHRALERAHRRGAEGAEGMNQGDLCDLRVSAV